MISRILIFKGLIFCSLLTAQELVIDSLPYQDGYRKLRLIFPKHYENQERPILLMLDAQNLFDDSTSYAGEWQVDEAIGKLSDDQQPIVFAVDHGNEKRIDELTPFSNEKYGGGKAEEFMNWMLQQALPTVMNKYNIANTERKAIVGSSLGGLFSHYVAINFPDEFETVGVMSPSYWYSDSIYDATTKRKIVQKQRFWISGGTAEDESLISKIDQMQSLLELQGNTTVKVVILENAQHNEAQWRELFPQFLNWWFRLED